MVCSPTWPVLIWGLFPKGSRFYPCCYCGGTCRQPVQCSAPAASACWVFTSFSWLCWAAVLTTVRYDERRQNLNGKWRRDSPSESCFVKAHGFCRRRDAIGRARGPFFGLVKECWAFLEPYSLSSRNDWTIGQNPTHWPGLYISFEELQILIQLISWLSLWLLGSRLYFMDLKFEGSPRAPWVLLFWRPWMWFNVISNWIIICSCNSIVCFWRFQYNISFHRRRIPTQNLKSNHTTLKTLSPHCTPHCSAVHCGTIHYNVRQWLLVA